MILFPLALTYGHGSAAESHISFNYDATCGSLHCFYTSSNLEQSCFS